MSILSVYHDHQPEHAEVLRDRQQIAARLAEIDVRYERWTANCELAADADQETVLDAYAEPVKELKETYGFQSADVISVGPEHPQKAELRAKFLDEHTHDDFEVRFFVEGRGLFFLHPNDKVYAVLCEQGDLLSVPAGVKHWFDMGENPYLKSIRLFTKPDGWVATFTGSQIGKTFPMLEQFLQAYA